MVGKRAPDIPVSYEGIYLFLFHSTELAGDELSGHRNYNYTNVKRTQPLIFVLMYPQIGLSLVNIKIGDKSKS